MLAGAPRPAPLIRPMRRLKSGDVGAGFRWLHRRAAQQSIDIGDGFGDCDGEAEGGQAEDGRDEDGDAWLM